MIKMSKYVETINLLITSTADSKCNFKTDAFKQYKHLICKHPFDLILCQNCIFSNETYNGTVKNSARNLLLNRSENYE